ncbi:MAG: hypothetical protein JOZ87_37485 [Chloroflexi bacterium]|nr:hypothetical protein [Chloroflexota bacterium]
MADASSESDFEPTPFGGGGGRETFVVRIWSSDGRGRLRGNVQHVRSRKRTYFATRERLMRFIRDHSRDADGSPCPG